MQVSSVRSGHSRCLRRLLIKFDSIGRALTPIE
jgi:hypothetical protein